MKKFLLILLFIFIFSSPAHASYTLPYPGVMPGNKLYVVSELFDELKSFLAFGDFASFSYSLSQSDKYLVEAKTLFEYDQFLLASNALMKSNKQVILAGEALNSARLHGKNISEKEQTLLSAIQKHNSILERLLHELPGQYEWKDENRKAVVIPIHSQLQEAIVIRNSL